MKYKLIIDPNAEEEVVVSVHAPSALTQQIENLVRSFSGTECLMGYRDDEMRKLTFEEIESIAGIPIDHSFLSYKKELLEYGFRVKKYP